MTKRAVQDVADISTLSIDKTSISMDVSEKKNCKIILNNKFLISNHVIDLVILTSPYLHVEI